MPQQDNRMQAHDSDPATIPLPFESKPGDERYVLRMRRDVLRVFAALAKRPVPIWVKTDQLGAAFSSRLIAFNPFFEELIFDASNLPGADRLDGRGGLTARVQMDAIWYRFEAAHVITLKGYPQVAFRAQIPKMMDRLQRRSSARVAVPTINPPTLDIRTSAEEDSGVRLRAIDISSSGIALLVEDSRLAIELGRKFTLCTLHLPDIGAINTDLEVMYLAPFGEGDKRRLGGRFSNLPVNALEHLQRYVLRLEHVQQGSSDME
jgi:c-di-GMP-binding flagellar brake protein YcgR